MPYLVRKIDLAKWKQRPPDDPQGPSADAITGCMRTRGNTLSVWFIDDEVQLSDAVVALAANFDHLDSITVAVYSEKNLREFVEIRETVGLTPYVAFADRHRDLCDLNYVALGEVAQATMNCIGNNSVHRFTRARLIELLTDAVRHRKIKAEDLKPSVREKLPV